MGLIKLFILGFAGYFASGLYDLAVLHRKPMLRMLLYPGFFVTALPYFVIYATHQSPFPIGARAIFLTLVICFAALLAWSVLLEIPLSTRKTHKPSTMQRANTDLPPQEQTIYTRGTYRFSRHPGFLWFTMVNALTSLYFLDTGIALLCAGFTLCNLVLIAVEDLVLFPRMFAGYDAYKQRTAFLLSVRITPHRSNRP